MILKITVTMKMIVEGMIMTVIRSFAFEPSWFLRTDENVDPCTVKNGVFSTAVWGV